MSESPPSIKQLGRYDIVRVLGQGAMGVVYEGRDPNLDRRVAIKTVRVTGMSAGEAAEFEHRFKTEARSAGRLQHPHIVSVYDSARHDDAHGQTAYIVMEYIEGQDLKHYLDQGKRFSLEETTSMMTDLLAALDYAHRNKVIHRDIKPANMLLTQDSRIKLTDFGVARMTDTGEATKTQGGAVGTLKYMSPEQVAGKAVDASSDLFSAGIVLYQLLTGLRPFDGEGYLDIVSKIVKEDPKPPSHVAGALPPALDTVVARALAKSKLDRFPDAASFSAALKSAVSNADLTIIPSAQMRADYAASGLGTMSGTFSGTSSGSMGGSGLGSTGTAGSTVTQELELVYWKDIKDSMEPEVFEGFLRRFPVGIYADLAKRKLKSLGEASRAGVNSAYSTNGANSRFEATAWPKSGDGTMSGFPNTRAASPYEATSPSYTATHPDGQRLTQAAAAISSDDDPTLPPGVAAGRAPVVSTAAATATGPAIASGSSAAKPKSSARWAVLAMGIAAVAAAGWWALRPGAAPTAAGAGGAGANDPSPLPIVTPTQVVTPSNPWATTETQASVTSTVPLRTETALTSVATNTRTTASFATGATTSLSLATSTLPRNSPTSTVAGLPAITASAASRPSRRASAVVDPYSTTTTNAPVITIPGSSPPAVDPNRGDTSRPSTPAGTSSLPAGPREACAGRGTFGFNSCMSQQCEGNFRNHPVCVERRDQEEQRKRDANN
jgi:eukaryotic-like serine/threonine-protein kinase